MPVDRCCFQLPTFRLAGVQTRVVRKEGFVKHLAHVQEMLRPWGEDEPGLNKADVAA